MSSTTVYGTLNVNLPAAGLNDNTALPTVLSPSNFV